jgi:hypothetical protein
MSNDEQTGGCLCGAVRYTATDVDPMYHACHCGMCLRWGGAPFMGAHVGNVTFEGAEYLRRYGSSEWAERGFCKLCGSSLFYYMKPHDRYSLCAGTFDDQSSLTLVDEIFIDRKPPGYAFAGDLPAMTEAEVIARFTAEPPE